MCVHVSGRGEEGEREKGDEGFLKGVNSSGNDFMKKNK